MNTLKTQITGVYVGSQRKAPVALADGKITKEKFLLNLAVQTDKGTETLSVSVPVGSTEPALYKPVTLDVVVSAYNSTLYFTGSVVTHNPQPKP